MDLDTINYSCENIKCNIIVNTRVLIDFFEELCRYPDCGEKINIVHDVKKKKGLTCFVQSVPFVSGKIVSVVLKQ